MVLQDDMEMDELERVALDENRQERFEREWEQMEDEIYRQVLAIGSFARSSLNTTRRHTPPLPCSIRAVAVACLLF